MIQLKLRHNPEGLNILCIGAHCDDIEIGCGGTLLKLFRQYPIANLTWVVFASHETRISEAHKNASQFLKCIRHKRIEIHNYMAASRIKKEFEQLKQIKPDIIFTHSRSDCHNDHRLLGELSWETFKDHMILEYETPEQERDLGLPNLYVHLDEKTVQKKLDILMRSFQLQMNEHWFSLETFEALMRMRGLESAAPSKYAEAFHIARGLL